MSSSSRDSAARIREQTNNTLLQRAQQREKDAQTWARKAEQDLVDARALHKKSADEADEQLKTLCVAFDTLVEFILLNHGEIPEKLVEIIAARQEQRIETSLPKADFVHQGVQESDVVKLDVGKLVVGAVAPTSHLSAVARQLVGQTFDRLDAEEIKRDLIERLAKARDD